MGKNRAEQYRKRAHELRAIAHDWMDRQKQQTLLWLARDYEKMAGGAERQVAEVAITSPFSLRPFGAAQSPFGDCAIMPLAMGFLISGVPTPDSNKRRIHARGDGFSFCKMRSEAHAHAILTGRLGASARLAQIARARKTMDAERLAATGKYALGLVAGALAAWAFSGSARNADPMLASYVQHGYPGCLTQADLYAHLADVEQTAHISRNEARARIARFIDHGVPPLSWTRFALYPDALKNWSGPAAQPCANLSGLLGPVVSRR